MQWDSRTRSTYLTAYILGLHYGYVSGCNAGYASYRPKDGSISTEDTDYYARCENRFPISSRDPTEFREAITEFYANYPRLRSKHISDILLELYAGRTIKQIHDEFSLGRVPQP